MSALPRSPWSRPRWRFPARVRRLGAPVAIGLALVWLVPGAARGVIVHSHSKANLQGPRGWQVLGAARHGPTFYRPTAVAVDGAGRAYLSDAGNFRIVRLSRSGGVLGSWGGRGTGPGAFGTGKACGGCEPLGPGSVAVGKRGVVYVDDPANKRIETFTATGRFVAAWHPGLAEPVSLAVDGAGHVLAAEDGNEVVRLSSTGEVLARWQIAESGHADVTIRSVTVDARGDVYAAAWWPDSSHPQYQQHWFVQKLTPTGQRLATWQDVGGVLAAAPNGALYVGREGTLEVLEQSGRVVARWGDQRFTSIAGISADGHGNVYVVDDQSNRVVELSPAGKSTRQWGVGGTKAGRFVTPWDVDLDGAGNIYVDDVRAEPTRIERLSPSGRARSGWAAAVAHGMGVDRQGNVYVLAYPGRAVLREYAPTGRLAGEWPLDKPASRLTVDQRGDVYLLADCSSSLCVERLRQGHVLGTWVLPADSRVVGDGPIAVDSGGNVYVTELLPDLRYGIQRIPAASEPGQVAPTQLGSSSWSSLSGMAVDRHHNVYVVETTRDRVQKLSPRGKLLATWGRAGSRPGQFHQPADVAVDPHGNLYVTDSGNSRIQKLVRK